MPKQYKHVVSLGSSFAAGPSIPPIADVYAKRSHQNYACLLAKALGAQHTDLTVSGATTDNILSIPQVTGLNPLNRFTFPPQIEGLPEDADLVTITAG